MRHLHRHISPDTRHNVRWDLSTDTRHNVRWESSRRGSMPWFVDIFTDTIITPQNVSNSVPTPISEFQFEFEAQPTVSTDKTDLECSCMSLVVDKVKVGRCWRNGRGFGWYGDALGLQEADLNLHAQQCLQVLVCLAARHLPITQKIDQNPHQGKNATLPTLHTSYPTLDTSYPTLDTSYPTLHTSCPTLHISCPTLYTSYPTLHTSCPTLHTSCPTLHTSCPNKACIPSVHMSNSFSQLATNCRGSVVSGTIANAKLLICNRKRTNLTHKIYNWHCNFVTITYNLQIIILRVRN